VSSPRSAEPGGTLGAVPRPSALDAHLAEIDRRLRTIQSGLEPAAHADPEPRAFPGPTLVPPPSPSPSPAPPPDPAATRDGEAGDLVAHLRDLVAGQERWLASARELLAAYDAASGPVSVSAGPFAGIAALRRFESALAALPEVRRVTVREYVGDDRAVVDVHLSAPPIS